MHIMKKHCWLYEYMTDNWNFKSSYMYSLIDYLKSSRWGHEGGMINSSLETRFHAHGLTTNFSPAENINWADSWDFGTYRPPKTQSSNVHAQPSSGARYLIFGRTLRLLPYFICAQREGSGETARRLALAFAVRLCDKYHNLMSWLNLQWQLVKPTAILNNLVLQN